MKLKQEKGSVTLFVLVSLLFFVLFLSGMYLLSSSREQTGYVETAKVKEIYESDVSRADDVYETLVEGRDILNELKIGDTVIYTPPEATYTWQAEYCSSGTEENAPTTDIILKNTDNNYKITEWKVFNINGDTRQIELISAKPTSGTVYLGGAQGYNNGVYLLNEACNTLYGDSKRGIIGRSINIEDIEERMTNDALNGENGAYKYTYDGTQYGTQIANAYTTNKNYPSIYLQEKFSVIDEKANVDEEGNEIGIGRSEQNVLIDRTYNEAIEGVINAKISIQPYQTYWYIENNGLIKKAFKTDKYKDYYDLIIPLNSAYWIASRYIATNSIACYFGISYIDANNGGVAGAARYYSIGESYGSVGGMRPIITLNDNNIKGSKETGWSVTK